MLTVYSYEKCSTCRAAAAWLTARQIAFREVAIKERPPDRAALERMVAAHGGDRRRVFNTSGLEYRRLKLAERLPGLTDDAAYGLLTRNGMLVKRPFVLGPGVALLGFDARAWSEALA